MALENIMEGGIGIAVLVIVIFSVTLAVTNSFLSIAAASNVTKGANLSGASLTLAQQTPLMIVLAFVFVPIAAFAIYALKMVG